MYVPMPILKALYHVMPDRVLAEGSGAVWSIADSGQGRATACRSPARCSTIRAAWARARTKRGPSATCYPTGIAAVPVEVLEAAMPIVFDSKELRRGSGGAGESRGGDGQTIAWHMRT